MLTLFWVSVQVLEASGNGLLECQSGYRLHVCIVLIVIIYNILSIALSCVWLCFFSNLGSTPVLSVPGDGAASKQVDLQGLAISNCSDKLVPYCEKEAGLTNLIVYGSERSVSEKEPL